MSRFLEWYQNHAVHSALDSLRKSISIAEEDHIESVDSVTELTRLKSALDFIQESLEAIEPEIVPANHTTAQLSQIQSALANAENHLNNYAANRNHAELVNANKQTDTALQTLPQINFIRAKSAARGVAAVTRNFSETAEGYLTGIEELTNSLQRELGDAQKAVQQQNERLGAIATEIDDYRRNVDSVFESFQKQLESARQAALTEIEQMKQQQATTVGQFVQESKQAFQTKLNEFAQAFDRQKGTLAESAESIIHALEAKRDAAARLLEVTTNMAVAGDFKLNADRQRHNANVMRVLAIIFMMIAIGGAAYVIFIAESGGRDWTFTLLRLLTSGLFTIPATYAAKESAKHRRLESQYRRVQLDLAALDPFIELLPEEKKQELKSEITQRVFGRSYEGDLRNRDEDEVSAPTFLSLVERLSNFFGK